jgi:hypothetical protein
MVRIRCARLPRSDNYLASAGGYAAPDGHVKSAWYTTFRIRPDVNTASQTRSRAVSITWRRRAETAGSRRWMAGGIAEITCTMCAARAHGASLAQSTPHSKPSSTANLPLPPYAIRKCANALFTPASCYTWPSCSHRNSDRHVCLCCSDVLESDMEAHLLTCPTRVRISRAQAEPYWHQGEPRWRGWRPAMVFGYRVQRPLELSMHRLRDLVHSGNALGPDGDEIPVDICLAACCRVQCGAGGSGGAAAGAGRGGAARCTAGGVRPRLGPAGTARPHEPRGQCPPAGAASCT